METTAEGARENLEGPVGILLTQYLERGNISFLLRRCGPMFH